MASAPQEITPAVASARPRRGESLRALIRYRLRQIGNAVDQQLTEAPLRTLAVIALLALIWAALYLVLANVLTHVKTWGLVGVVARVQIFVHFFLVLAIMLAFSNAILTFGTLFGRGEPGYLLSLPLRERHVVMVKWVESVLLSSWSFLLLGVPLMLAIASDTEVQWYFYPLFLGHFLAFVAIPACVGLLAAWAIAMFAARWQLAILVGGILALIAAGVFWFGVLSSRTGSDHWLEDVLAQIGFARSELLPSSWTAAGVIAAVNERVGESLFYLGVVLANGAFLTWLTVHIVGGSWGEAYSRAQRGRGRSRIRRAWFTSLLCLPFFILPRPMRKLMLKDIRSFARDAKQWMQMVIMVGLLLLYVSNLPRFPLDLTNANFQAGIALLNLTTISLILATFTSRFIYPMLSLESHQLWLLELLPVRRLTLLLVKFLFALAVTLLSAVGVMAIAVQSLKLPLQWAEMHLLICVGVCIGLSGLAIGLGARFPSIGQRNPARIAAGFGGTFNLIASMVFVIVMMAGVGWISYRQLGPEGIRADLAPENWLLVFGMLGLSVLVGGGSLIVGAQHFERLEV